MHGIVQEDVRGGNAVNLAHSLATLGAKVLLITHSDAEHSGMLREVFAGLGAELRIKPLPPGLTLSIESRVNVMLSDSGGAANFPSSLLTGSDWAALRRAKVVCSVNWSSNKQGTELLFALRRELGRGKTLFLNPSDARDRFEEYSALMKSLEKRHIVDWISLNEYEAETTVKALGMKALDPRGACLVISRRLGVRVDIHTEWAVHTSSGPGVVSVKTKHVQPRRLTGAGDVWDAASLTAFVRGMDDRHRLEFANAAARLYVKAAGPSPPTLGEVVKGLR